MSHQYLGIPQDVSENDSDYDQGDDQIASFSDQLQDPGFEQDQYSIPVDVIDPDNSLVAQAALDNRTDDKTPPSGSDSSSTIVTDHVRNVIRSSYLRLIREINTALLYNPSDFFDHTAYPVRRDGIARLMHPKYALLGAFTAILWLVLYLHMIPYGTRSVYSLSGLGLDYTTTIPQLFQRNDNHTTHTTINTKTPSNQLFVLYGTHMTPSWFPWLTSYNVTSLQQSLLVSYHTDNTETTETPDTSMTTQGSPITTQKSTPSQPPQVSGIATTPYGITACLPASTSPLHSYALHGLLFLAKHSGRDIYLPHTHRIPEHANVQSNTPAGEVLRQESQLYTLLQTAYPSPTPNTSGTSIAASSVPVITYSQHEVYTQQLVPAYQNSLSMLQKQSPNPVVSLVSSTIQDFFQTTRSKRRGYARYDEIYDIKGINRYLNGTAIRFLDDIEYTVANGSCYRNHYEVCIHITPDIPDTPDIPQTHLSNQQQDGSLLTTCNSIIAHIDAQPSCQQCPFVTPGGRSLLHYIPLTESPTGAKDNLVNDQQDIPSGAILDAISALFPRETRLTTTDSQPTPTLVPFHKREALGGVISAAIGDVFHLFDHLDAPLVHMNSHTLAAIGAYIEHQATLPPNEQDAVFRNTHPPELFHNLPFSSVIRSETLAIITLLNDMSREAALRAIQIEKERAGGKTNSPSIPTPASPSDNAHVARGESQTRKPGSNVVIPNQSIPPKGHVDHPHRDESIKNQKNRKNTGGDKNHNDNNGDDDDNDDDYNTIIDDTPSNRKVADDVQDEEFETHPIGIICGVILNEVIASPIFHPVSQSSIPKSTGGEHGQMRYQQASIEIHPHQPHYINSLLAWSQSNNCSILYVHTNLSTSQQRAFTKSYQHALYALFTGSTMHSSSSSTPQNPQNTDDHTTPPQHPYVHRQQLVWGCNAFHMCSQNAETALAVSISVLSSTPHLLATSLQYDPIARQVAMLRHLRGNKGRVEQFPVPI